ncbi:hypothetical protein [Lacimonas salitolerans]|uniref:Uncharacterized protein n=1 Tax=Lacimonas salitolerans TaxID=1323750 RepID=A0ABW4ECW4_9RHOB
MTDFTPPAQIDDTEKPSTARRAYIAPTITFASADKGPEGKAYHSYEQEDIFGPS